MNQHSEPMHSKKTLSNKPFNSISVGDSATLTRGVNENDIAIFAASSGDVNPAHLDKAYAATDMFGHIIIHGMWTAGLISTLLGTQLPGPGTIYLGQELRFRKPVAPGDTITALVTVTEKREEKHIVLLNTVCKNQRGEEVLSGTATVIAPTVALTINAMDVPDVTVHRHDRYQEFVAHARSLPSLKTAIVHPCSIEALHAVVEARNEGLIDPILVGPQHKIMQIAASAKLCLDGIAIDNTEHSHAAAIRAVELAATGKVQALMKGSLHTDELLTAVLASNSGLRTARRISHVYLFDVPSYSKPLIVTDAAINIAPTLDQKRDICQNAIDLMRILGIEQPKVAVVAAVETVNPAMPATLDAAALTVMAARGQITGGIVDGPLAFDNAIDMVAAQIKGIQSPVAGQADILLVPDIEVGNMLAKQLIYFAGADAAGLVLGARVPIILTSRSDSLRVRIASVALAKLVAERSKQMITPT